MKYLGQAEDQTLEFKGRAVLKDLSAVARAAVAMLNAEGGTVWIGVGENSGRAASVEPIDHVLRERERVMHHLRDSIEPTPDGQDVQLTEEPVDGGHVLKLRLDPNRSKQPYAQLKNGTRRFLLRVGAQVRDMTRQEWLGAVIRARGNPAGGGPPNSPQLQFLASERKKFLEAGRPWFWHHIQPLGDCRIDFGKRGLVDKVRQYLIEPKRSGNRRLVGYSAVHPYWGLYENGGRLIVTRDGRGIGAEPTGYTWVFANGALQHQAPLSSLFRVERDFAGEIHPLALFEKAASLFRLARAIHADQDIVGHPAPAFGSDLAFSGSSDLKLRGGSHNSLAFNDDYLASRSGLLGRLDGSFELTQPLTFERQELGDAPDRCAFRLMEKVYEAFGIDPAHITPEYDRRRGVLDLPE